MEMAELSDNSPLILGGQAQSVNPVYSNTEKPGTSKLQDAFRQFTQSSIVRVVGGGQLVSLMTCGTGVTSQLLFTNYGVAVPTCQLVLNYVLLALVYSAVLFSKGTLRQAFTERWLRYLIYALVDVEANYVVVKVSGICIYFLYSWVCLQRGR